MKKRTRTLTLSALFSALAVISLFVASVWPTGQLGLAAFASLFVAAAVVEMGLGSGACVFVVASALSMLLLPNRVPPLLFVLFFGYYPVAKSFIERLRGKLLQWVLKLLAFSVSFTVLWFFFREIVFSFNTSLNFAFIFLSGAAIFALFDYGFTKVIWLYINRVSRFTRK